jgi:farnesyl diphosphate synthase
MTTKPTDLNLDDLFQLCNKRLEAIFSSCLSTVPSPDLKAAMQYTLSNGGKRLRPMLVYATGYIFNAPWENMDVAASAVEMIHTYSLIHDDLPSMDDADLRRGKATCHKAFGEGMAILSGDGLQALAIQVLARQPAALKPDRRLQMVNVLADAAGPYGMVAGQALDITMMNDAELPDDLLRDIYSLKTGALFTASIELGRLASNDNDDVNQQALRDFGNSIGLAFQIQDDVLDIESETGLLGKPRGIDVKNHKSTYAKLHGVAAAKDKVQALYLDALESINYLGENAQLLRELVKQMLQRNK